MTTWRAADVDTVIGLIHTFSGWGWPMPEEDVPILLEKLGWVPRDSDPCILQSNLAVTPGVAMVVGVEDAYKIDFAVTDANRLDNRVAKADFVQDVFASYAARFSEEWGDPVKRVVGGDPELWWAVDGGGAVRLTRDPLTVGVTFYTPQGVALERAVGDL